MRPSEESKKLIQCNTVHETKLNIDDTIFSDKPKNYTVKMYLIACDKMSLITNLNLYCNGKSF